MVQKKTRCTSFINLNSLLSIYIYVCIMYIHVHVYLYIYVCIYTYVYYIYIHIIYIYYIYIHTWLCLKVGDMVITGCSRHPLTSKCPLAQARISGVLGRPGVVALLRIKVSCFQIMNHWCYTQLIYIYIIYMMIYIWYDIYIYIYDIYISYIYDIYIYIWYDI